MRGRSCTQPFLVEGGACRPDAFLLPPRWVSRSPPHPTRLRRPTYGLWWLRLDLTEQSPGLFDPRGEGFGGGWELPCRVSSPLPSNGLAREGTPSRSGRQPVKRPEGPNPPFRPTDSPGRARLAEFRRPQPVEKDKIIFSPGMYRGKYSSHPESAGFAGAVRGATPNFERGPKPNRTLDTPVLCPPERRQTPGAPLRNSSATAAAPTPAPPAPPG